jgi:hypothetical protein
MYIGMCISVYIFIYNYTYKCKHIYVYRQTKEEREGLVESHLKTELLESLQRLPISFGMAMTSRDKCIKVYIYINIYIYIYICI